MKTILFALSLLCAFTVQASRKFVAASSQYENFNTTLGAFETNSAFSVVADVKVISNATGSLLCKQDVTANIRGWLTFHRAGTTSPQFALSLTSVNGVSAATARTTTEFPTNIWWRVVWTYGGGGNVASMAIRVGGTNIALTTISDALVAGTIQNAVASQLGARGGTAAATLFANCYVRRLLLYTNVLSGANLTAVEAGTSVPTTGLLLWQEFDSLCDGATLTPDWSEAGNVGFVVGATYSTDDPTITTVAPDLGTSGGKTLSGPLTKWTNNPVMKNLGWAGQSVPNGLGDQIGPGISRRWGWNEYRAWPENTAGTKTLDTNNQPGAFDYDTPTTYATSTDGYTWTISQQDVATNTIFNCNNINGDATFKTAVQAETSIQAMIYNPIDMCWMAFFHGGNNSQNATGMRRIYGATNNVDPSTANWKVINGGAALLIPGASGAWDGRDLAAGPVLWVNATNMMMAYWAGATNGVYSVGMATSADRGFTWTKYASNPIFGTNGAAVWEGGNHFVDGFFYDEPLRLYVMWFAAGQFGVTSGSEISAAVGYAYSSDGFTWTRGTYNPVAAHRDLASAQNNWEYFGWGTSGQDWFDAGKYRHIQRNDNGVSGVTGGRGRGECYNFQIVKTPYRFFGL